MFDAKLQKNRCVEWIREFFEKNGKDCNAVVGISGGKDSSVVAALCAEALGRERVIGVLMPCGVQHDIDMAELLVQHIGIKSHIVNIEAAVRGLTEHIPVELSEQSRVNLPARIRMAALYAVSQSYNGRGDTSGRRQGSQYLQPVGGLGRLFHTLWRRGGGFQPMFGLHRDRGEGDRACSRTAGGAGG